jgi:hypothetical protein
MKINPDIAVFGRDGKVFELEVKKVPSPNKTRHIGWQYVEGCCCDVYKVPGGYIAQPAEISA